MMPGDMPDLYFRRRANGAQVFRVLADRHNGRLDLILLATVNLKTGTLRPQGDRVLRPEETRQIDRQIDLWRQQQTPGMAAQAEDAITALNRAAHWAQTKAEDAEIEAATMALLLAMHDLRSVLTRRKAEIARNGGDADD